MDIEITNMPKPVQTVAADSRTAPPDTRENHLWAGAEPSFHDVLDALNPLHQIPVVSSVYEHFTGDTIGILPRIAGGLLFGGPIGLVAAIATGAFEQATGSTPGETVMAALTDQNGKLAPDPGTAVAEARAGGADRDLSSSGPAPQAPSAGAVFIAQAGLGADRDPGIANAPAPQPAKAPDAPSTFVAQHQMTPREAADQLAAQAAHEARFGRSTRPLMMQQASMLAAADGASNLPLLTQAPKVYPPGVSNQRGLPAQIVHPTRPATTAASTATEGEAASAEASQPAGAPPEGIPKAMMTALDKYQQLLKQREAAVASQPGTQVDISQ